MELVNIAEMVFEILWKQTKTAPLLDLYLLNYN